MDGLVQERRNSSANALELHLSCTNPSMLWSMFSMCFQCIYVTSTATMRPMMPCPSTLWATTASVFSLSHSPWTTKRYLEGKRGAHLTTLRLRQNGWHYANNIFKFIFMYEHCYILIEINWNLFTNGQLTIHTTEVTYISLIQIVAWYQTGDRPLSEPMMT